MFGNAWWKTTDKNKIPEEPDLCDLCGKVIDKEDYYYLGLTYNTETFRAWAFTCTQFKCVQWLVAKDRRIKTNGAKKD